MSVRFHLLVILLGAIVMVMPVSSGEQIGQDIPQQPGSVVARVTYGIFDDPPFAEITVNPDDNSHLTEFVCIVIGQRQLETPGNAGRSGLVTFTVPSEEVYFTDRQAGTPADVPIHYIAAAMLPADEPVAILWAPSAVIELSRSNNTITITCPEQMLLRFDSSAHAVTELENAESNEFQISEIPRDTRFGCSKSEDSVGTTTSPSERRWYTATSTNIDGVTGIMQ